MPLGDITLVGTTYREVTAVAGRYAAGDGLAIQLYTEGEPLANLTVNTATPRKSPLVWAKDYAENEGLVDQLAEQGLLRRTGNTLPSGHIELVEVELLGHLAEIGLAAAAPGQPN